MTLEYQLIDFKNAVEQMAEPEVEKKPLLPVFEAIHNSIHSIQQANRTSGEIVVEFVRNNGDMDPKSIIEIVISDNGSGFTRDNILSFGKLFSTHKKDQYNCKGIGRLAFFVPFFKVKIKSIFYDNHKYYSIDTHITENNFYETVNIQAVETPETEVKTSITLTSIDPARAHWYKIGSTTIINEITQHFLPSLLSIKNIRIKIIDGEEYFLDDSVKDVSRDKPILIESSTFDIYHLKNRSPHRSTHKIILSANGRSVKELPISFLPKGKIGNDDDRYYLNTVVISDLLNEKLNAQRNEFNIPKTKGLVEGSVDLGSIYEHVLSSSRVYCGNSIKHLEGVLDEFIEKTFDELPHLSFLRDDADVRNKLKLGDDSETVKNAYVKKFSEKQVESFNYVKIITKKYESNEIPNFDEFQKDSLMKLEEGMKINHAPLVSYVKYRDFVLNIYEKLLSKRSDGKYQPEKILHDILFPTKSNSVDSEVDYFKHNLWIIDDRYAVYDFLTSDLPEHAVSEAEFNAEDKRYDICAAYSDPIGEEHNVFIVELKKTSLPLSENNDPITQIRSYVQRMMNGKLSKHNGTRINITDTTQFYGLVLCDVHSDYFKNYMIAGHSLKKRPDSKSYHAVLLNERFFLEVTNYENLLGIAHARNKVFIDKLNHK